ncbi:hypothetical protein BGZ63DRAFT_407750 [Mariannaea sp. PMI_226]|nr:hypothetical protein BGZ63DRAFT_407750 [Mariannaea sp. PMI_226]
MLKSTIQRWPRLSHLILLAGYASATLVLSNFDELQDHVPKACSTAYDTALDCKTDDFLKHDCSGKCRDSISDVQKIVQKKCSTVDPSNSDSLLSRALKGQLVQVLCKSDDSSSDHEEHQSTTAKHTTATHATTTAHRNAETTMTTKQSTTEAPSAQAETTSVAPVQTSLAVADESNAPSGVVDPTASSSAKPSSTGGGRGGDPFANNVGNAGSSVAVGYITLLVSAFVGVVAVM